ncbi:MAG: hypothetical protein LBU32_27980 [Clostridiales bacterium]|nr:hypothetical protein [Clostridiales bacterium]
MWTAATELGEAAAATQMDEAGRVLKEHGFDTASIPDGTPRKDEEKTAKKKDDAAEFSDEDGAEVEAALESGRDSDIFTAIDLDSPKTEIPAAPLRKAMEKECGFSVNGLGALPEDAARAGRIEASGRILVSADDVGAPGQKAHRGECAEEETPAGEERAKGAEGPKGAKNTKGMRKADPKKKKKLRVETTVVHVEKPGCKGAPEWPSVMCASTVKRAFKLLVAFLLANVPSSGST